MNIAVLITTPDFAGLNIQTGLLTQASWQKTPIIYENQPVWLLKTATNTIYMFTTDTKCIFCEHYDEKIAETLNNAGISWKTDLLLFPTTHRSEKGVQSICVHAPGNFGHSLLGGDAGKLCPTNPQVLRFLWEQLKIQCTDVPTHEVVMEATHHGPALDVPTIFVEIGSDETSWNNSIFGKKTAAALLSLFNADIPALEKRFVPAFGIGGPHYAPNFLKCMEQSNYALGHLCAKYAVEGLTGELIKQAITKSNARIVLLDGKGLGGRKQEIKELLERNAILYKTIGD
ncbi:MAG: D-aminoacyl-tRNA deacylase [Candidatus Woesearchaeota archaeon]|nr:D-aminoacyl-tRNA deacylase [Candidatus Woesearchaeota archaeon]